MTFAYDPAAPNEVGTLVYHDDEGNLYQGLLVISADPDSTPLVLTPMPEEMESEYVFAVSLSPIVAHVLGASQAAENGEQVADGMLAASKAMWWMTVRLARLLWKEEVHDNPE